MYWEKHGIVFRPNGQHGWINTHAQVPTALVLRDRIRVYFATRPRRDLSLPTFVDLDRNDPSRIIALNAETLLPPGRPGTFDADGVMPSCAIRDDDRVLLYYSGWSRLGGLAPYNNATGLAVSYDDGATFERMFEGPVLDRTPEEPWSATSPAVIRHDGVWHIWYSSGIDWIDVGGKLEHVYVLKHGVSDDGVHWRRDALQTIECSGPNESQTRPTIAHLGDRWHMWFAYRGSIAFRTTGETYRIGYAWSDDLATWHRDDAAAGIVASAEGWDSQMISYPDVARVADRLLLFYNGNGFGEGGFGYATLEGTEQ